MYRPLLASLLATVSLAAQQPAGTMPAPMRPPSVISTSATGEARYVPDRATISVGVQTRAVTAAKASADNAVKQRAVIDAIRAQGIAADQISTVNYNLNAEQVYNPQAGDKAPKVTGYVATNTVRVEVKKVEQVGALIDAAIAKGANDVSSLDFHSSAPDSLRRVALADAYKQAVGGCDGVWRGGWRATGRTDRGDDGRASRWGAAEDDGVGEDGDDRRRSTWASRRVNVSVMARWRFVTDAK